jgi:argininosuccinate synthase
MDLVENRLVGMKSHGVYETPGGTILYKAHRRAGIALPGPRHAAFKEQLAVRYAELVYFGKWYHLPARSDAGVYHRDAEDDHRLGEGEAVQGERDCRSGGTARTAFTAKTSPPSARKTCTIRPDAKWAFITLFGLQMKVKAMMEVSDGGKTRYAAPD